MFLGDFGEILDPHHPLIHIMLDPVIPLLLWTNAGAELSPPWHYIYGHPLRLKRMFF